MDAVGTVASVITITRLIGVVVVVGFTIVTRSSFFGAQRSLEKLQDDIHRLKNLLTDVEEQGAPSASKRLLEHHLKLRELDRKLKSIGNTSTTYFPTAYIRLKPFLFRWKMKRLETDFKDLKDEIDRAINVQSCIQITKSSTLLQYVTQTQRRYNQQVSYDGGLIMESLLLSPQTQPGFPNEGAQLRLSSRASPHETSSAKFVPPEFNTAKIGPCQQPAGILELSRNFYPESYTSRRQVPNCIVTARQEVALTSQSSKNLYEILYFQAPRKGVHVKVYVDIPVVSQLWRFTRLTRHRFPRLTHGTPYEVPMGLVHNISQCLDSIDHLQADSAIHIVQSNDDDSTLVITNVTKSIEVYRSDTVIEREELATRYSLYHMGCRTIDERAVVRLACLDLPDRFLVRYEGRFLEEIVSLHRPSSEAFRYRIQMLHSLRNEVGFVRLAGITVDHATHHIKSALVEWPPTACELLLHRASDPSSQHPWHRVASWSLQLLQRLRAVHTAGGVVGKLRDPRPPVYVDAFDQVYLWHFNQKFSTSAASSPFYPPEYRYLAQSASNVPIRSDDPHVTPAYDIYQCGQILWMLAAGWASPDKTALDLKREFYNMPESCQKGLWFGHDPLPRLSESVPSWFQEIVDRCCASNPLERPSCEDLIKLFPPTIKDASTSDAESPVNPEPQNEEAMRACRGRSTMCSYCHRQVIDLMYCCTICDGGDIDLCPRCFEAGKHCYDTEHLIIEVNIGVGLPIKTSYHSSKDARGRRKVFAM